MQEESRNINLILKYLNNEMSEEESIKFDKKLANDEDFRKIFATYKELWDLLNNTPIDKKIVDIDLDSEWQIQKQKSGIENQPTKIVDFEQENKKKSPKWIYFVSMAAVLVLFVGIFFLFSNRKKEIIAQGKVITTVLPDSSKIVLNRNAKIEYAKNFKTKRKIKLQGDAYFKVSHDSLHPFVVETGKYNVLVVGTEFYVNSSDSSFEVDVKQGVVKVFPENKPNESIILYAGQKVEQKNNSLVKLAVKNENFLAWKNHKIVIENMTLQAIAELLQRTYGVEIIISDNNLKNLRMTATFENQPLNSVLRVIQQTLDIKIIKKGNKIFIINN